MVLQGRGDGSTWCGVLPGGGGVVLPGRGMVLPGVGEWFYRAGR